LKILVALLLPWPLKLILDYVILQKPLPEKVVMLSRWFGEGQWLLPALVLAFILLRIIHSLVTYLHKVGLLSAAERIVTDIRERIFAHLQRLSLSFHESARSGSLVYRLTEDINDVKTVLVQLPDSVAHRLLMIFTHGGLMLAIEWRLAVVAFSVIPILYFFNQRIGSGVQTARRKKRSKESDIASMVSENLTAMALVQAYGREDLQQSRFESENRESLASGVTATRLAKMFKRTSEILIAVGTAGVVYYGGRLAWEGTILPGTLVLFASYLKNLYSPLDKFATMLLDVIKSQIAGERLMELAECDMIVQDAPNAVLAPPFQGRIEFRKVNFGYHNDVPVLKNLSFGVESGQTIALVGHSGAGKSTLISLLLRFYDPDKGVILIDGHDLREFKLESLRSQITVVMQEARLFNETVRDNIAFGKADVTEEEIVRAAKLAHAHDFILQMPEGYDTMICEGGENLSGGQQQRINIARAIIRNTPILILDEPVTALDAKAEANIQQALLELTRQKTTFIIAHKFSTISHAEKILLFEKGCLIAHGKHEELLQSSPDYRALYELQAGPLLQETDEVATLPTDRKGYSTQREGEGN
jgi:ABC-type multidrug transport system fused ATPase/permease subunit